MKFFLFGQYWNKHDSFVNIEDSLLFIHDNMQENTLNNNYEIVQNVEYDYLRFLYFFLYFYNVRGKEIFKQKIPFHQ